MNETEKKIVTAILEDALKAGYLVSVSDGEETVIKKSRCLPCILDKMGSTDNDVLKFWRKSQGQDDPRGYVTFGVVVLIYGNDHDVISDCSDNQRMNKLLERATEIANEAC